LSALPYLFCLGFVGEESLRWFIIDERAHLGDVSDEDYLILKVFLCRVSVHCFDNLCYCNYIRD
jgi:hypothetical protein